MPSQKRLSPRLVFALLGVGLLIFAFFAMRKPAPEGGKGGPGGPGGRRNMPVPVTTAQVRTSNVPLRVEGIGNVESSDTVSVQARIGGQLAKVYFKPGDFVRAGQLLFTIDPSVAQAAAEQAGAVFQRSQTTVRQSQAALSGARAQVNLAEATLKRDQAQLAYAQAQEVRYRNLLTKNYVTQEQYGQIKTTMDAAQATVLADLANLRQAQAQVSSSQVTIQTNQAGVAADRAALESARLQVGFTRIHAPISGKTGPLLLYAGNIVQANVTPLVNISRLSPLQVAFSIPEKQLLGIQRAMAASPVAVTAVITDEDTPRRETGRLVFIDNNVDAASGTVRLKAEFDNTDHLLWPGRFVTVLIDLGVRPNALIIPARAVQTGQKGDFVYVIVNQRAQSRAVKVDRIVNGNAVIDQGLRAGETVVVEGGPQLAPGLKVIPR